MKESFPNTSRRQKIISKSEMVLNPLELACDKLRGKAAQLRKYLSDAGISPRSPSIGMDLMSKLDKKGMQCFLQGAVSPAVNVGVLAYAEAFTLSQQKEFYGQEGLDKLIMSFK